MNKIILKTALITIAAVIVAALAVFSLWILISPQTMATSCEKTGNYSLAVTCADLRYKYTKNISDLARCTEDSILSGKDKHIISYGEKLITDSGFEDLCADKDKLISGTDYGAHTSDYKSYVCGHISAAQYRDGNTDKAVGTAKYGGVKSFNKLVIEISEKADKPAAQKAVEALEDLPQSVEVESLLNILKKFA